MTSALTISSSPIGLVEALRDYGVKELGGLYIYLPLPRSAADQEVWAWLEMARLLGGIRGGPWRIDSARTPDWLRVTNPKLFVGAPLFFEVFRLDSDRLTALIDRIESRPGKSPNRSLR